MTTTKVLSQWSIDIELLSKIHEGAVKKGMKDPDFATYLIKLGLEV